MAKKTNKIFRKKFSERIFFSVKILMLGIITAAIIPAKFHVSAKYDNIISISDGRHYYVSNDGNDANSGISPELPWRTLEKVNSFNFQPGDTVHFKCGDTWRGQLIPKSGSESGYVKYTSYGIGNKPVIKGSIAVNNPLYWTDLGNNIWSTAPHVESISNTELVSNPGFDTNSAGWVLYKNTNNNAEANGAQVTEGQYEGAGCYKIELVNCGARGSDIQFSISGISMEEGKVYKLSFAAKGSKVFTIDNIKIIKGTSPFNSYVTKAYSPKITTEWSTYTYYFKSTSTADDGRLNFSIGGLSQLDATLYLDSISLKQCEVPNLLELDVGNIIFDNGEEIGVKRWHEGALTNQNDFWYDDGNQTLKMYSKNNPADMYNNIECALTKNIVNASNVSYVKLEGLHITTGGAHGIGATSTHHIIISNCDISFMGGGFMYMKEKTSYANPAPWFEKIPQELICYVRYGNGIQFFNDSHDSIVENCNIWEIYDAAVTNQATTQNSQYNIYYMNNNMRNFEYGLEIWNRPGTSEMHDIYFENNVLYNAGGGWGHTQRPDIQATHIMMFSSSSSSSNIFIQNNTFNATQQYCIYRDSSLWNGIADVVIDNNIYYINAGKTLAKWQGTNYAATTAGVSGYLEASKKDMNSKIYIIQ